MNRKLMKIVGVGTLVAAASGAGMVSSASAAPPPQIKLSAKRVVLDGNSCFTLTVDGRKFVQNSNTWEVIIAGDVPLGFGDVLPDGTFSTGEVTICGLIPRDDVVIARTSDGQEASTKIKIVEL